MHVDAGYSITDLSKLLMTSEKYVEEMTSDVSAPTFQDHGVRLRLVRDED